MMRATFFFALTILACNSSDVILQLDMRNSPTGPGLHSNYEEQQVAYAKHDASAPCQISRGNNCGGEDKQFGPTAEMTWSDCIDKCVDFRVNYCSFQANAQGAFSGKCTLFVTCDDQEAPEVGDEPFEIYEKECLAASSEQQVGDPISTITKIEEFARSGHGIALDVDEKTIFVDEKYGTKMPDAKAWACVWEGIKWLRIYPFASGSAAEKEAKGWWLNWVVFEDNDSEFKERAYGGYGLAVPTLRKNCPAGIKQKLDTWGKTGGQCWENGGNMKARDSFCEGSLVCARKGFNNRNFGCADYHCCVQPTAETQVGVAEEYPEAYAHALIMCSITPDDGMSGQNCGTSHTMQMIGGELTRRECLDKCIGNPRVKYCSFQPNKPDSVFTTSTGRCEHYEECKGYTEPEDYKQRWQLYDQDCLAEELYETSVGILTEAILVITNLKSINEFLSSGYGIAIHVPMENIKVREKLSGTKLKDSKAWACTEEGTGNVRIYPFLNGEKAEKEAKNWWRNWVVFEVDGRKFKERIAGGRGFAGKTIKVNCPRAIEEKLKALSKTIDRSEYDSDETAKELQKNQKSLTDFGGIAGTIFGIIQSIEKMLRGGYGFAVSVPVKDIKVFERYGTKMKDSKAWACTEEGVKRVRIYPFPGVQEALKKAMRWRCNWIVFSIDGGEFKEDQYGGYGAAVPTIRKNCPAAIAEKLKEFSKTVKPGSQSMMTQSTASSSWASFGKYGTGTKVLAVVGILATLYCVVSWGNLYNHKYTEITFGPEV